MALVLPGYLSTSVSVLGWSLSNCSCRGSRSFWSSMCEESNMKELAGEKPVTVSYIIVISKQKIAITF